jgi:hypothetical protein
MRFVRLAALLSLLAIAGSAAATSSAGVSAPTGLHAFLLRADEPAATTFHRTPSFAWNPVPGAVGYQFQISTSSTFQDNGIVYNISTLTTPVAAPSLILPWITGSPFALYARARATVSTGTSTSVTPWSDSFGFNVTPPPPPTPLPSDPGLLRWTPLEGASAYQVWLIDAKSSNAPVGKQETVRTNVLDEREFYTFHQSHQWIGTVRWRVRAVRSAASGGPANGLPATTYGAWSPIYSSSNPNMTGGPITLGHTISDVVSDGSATSDAHRLMPAFTWTGNTSLNGTAAELYRVYVFTDSQCLNLVYTSAVVGSPAYAPRPGGPLAMPQDASGIATARTTYLGDGTEANDEMYDGTPVTPQEQLPPATPTTTPPADPTAPGTTAPASGTGTTGTTSSGSAAPAGAPVDLWDTDWPQSGYFWTVVPVATVNGSPGTSTVAAPGASKGSTLVPVTDPTQFSVGQSVTVGVAPNSDTETITAVSSGLITLGAALNNGHAAGEPVTSTSSGEVTYQDLELPQDACAAGRVQRFGIDSEPSLTTSQAAFATGLSQTGRLTSALATPAFYGQPLVAWTPALGAQNYELQWSVKAYPFVALNTIMTSSTSAVLPLTPGTWYYRVRGFDYNLPTGVQQMSWSDPQQIVVTKPKFAVAKSPKTKFKIVGKSK